MVDSYKGYVAVALLFIVFFTPSSGHAAAESPVQWAEEQINSSTFSEIHRYWNEWSRQYSEFMPEIADKNLTDLVTSDSPLAVKEWLKGILKYLFYELVVNGKLLGSLIFLTLFSVILQTVQTAFESHTVNKVAYAVVYLILITLALNSFRLAVSYTNEAIETMSHFMISLIPLIMSLMAAIGNLSAVAFFHPVILFLIHISGVLIAHIVLPLFFLSALLHIVSSLSDHLKATQLANLLKNVGLALLGVFLTVFLGVVSLQGAQSAIQDGVVLKTAKFVTGNFIPVFGRMFTDATDTVLSASILLKNTVGLAGVVIVLGIALFPAVKVFVLSMIYKLAAAIMQPIGDGPVIKTMDLISKHIIYIFAALLVVTIMFFLAIVILVAASNLTLMIR
ncbi:stage III sporulation protein AE [Melghiribacillus thermohalophilus]|uniref:Stage III sporulation protein AE n=1 Tax=Melghiribacillus thermohalophilus TaxID=1324956 RepID=A0A4R3N3P0_9BACI|nr:stage III sporulation protein AE [Melghiribacillus thermohalophilus]TCT22626.1 stage III sporulation protein AE [Melghiribacillus thermohalophilus]